MAQKARYRRLEARKLGKGISWRVYNNSKSCACLKKHVQKSGISRRVHRLGD